MSHWLHICHGLYHLAKHFMDENGKLKVTCGMCKGLFQLTDPRVKPPVTVKCPHCGTVNKVC
jgi:phage FluMu protein Com